MSDLTIGDFFDKKKEGTHAPLANAMIVSQLVTKYTNQDDEVVITLHEGNDAKYYSYWMDKRDLKYHPISYGSRQKVLDGKDFIEKEKLNRHIQFKYFVDRDYRENILLDDSILETDRHSIENYYIDISVMERILKSHYAIPIHDANYQYILSLYKDDLSKFIESIHDLNLCIMYVDRINYFLEQKLIPREQLVAYKFPSESNIFEKDYIEYSTINCLVKKYDSIILKQNILDIVATHPHNELIKNIPFPEETSDIKNIRGKYLLKFVLKFLEQCQICKYIKHHTSVNNEFALSTYASYSEAVSGMLEYLETKSG